MNNWTAAWGRAVCFVASVMVLTSTSVWAQPNSWISPTSGNWDNAPSWSLGVLPNSSQSVLITNSGFKAVEINPSTPVNFPGSMTVGSLTVQAATNSDNLLLLNFFGTNVPLTVLNGLTVRDNAQIEDLNSGLVVQGGAVTVSNAQINQDGGFIITTNAPMSFQDAAYNLTNGDFEGGQVLLGNSVSAQFNQYNGTVLITNLVFGTSSGAPGAGGIYALYGGSLNLPGGLTIIGANNSFSSYLQEGGTNLTSSVFLEPGLFGISPSFTLNGGLLADNSVTLEADNYGSITLTQNGGTHLITNALNMVGGTFSITESHPAVYQLNGGTLSAGSIGMDASMGTASFNETEGIAQIGDIQGRPSQSPSYWVASVNLSGGTLASSNLYMTDGGTINQGGGTLIVSNLLAFNGFIQPGPTPQYSTYTLLAGTLIANNISVGGIWIIGDSPTNRISNPGTITLSNTIVISNAVEQLGRFILAGNATIDLAGSASQLSFANSSGETWAPGATLVISNWNGNLSGGGSEQLKFGSDSTGLTPQQLSQIEFINPAGLPAGTYSAQILSTGEVVPAQGSSGSGLVNSWINPASGRWDVATNWSLGVLPNSSQSVMITNSGFKAVGIDLSTPINFPGSMTVSNLTITSPTNGGNELLMNYVQAGNPLWVGSSNTPGSLIIGPNAFLVMLSSGLGVHDALGTNNSRLGEFEVDGTFTQSDGSEVVAGFLDLNGTYNLTNGQVFIGTQFVNGTFNQQGGANLGTVDMESTNGNYELFDGNMQGNVTVRAGTFTQWSGTNSGTLITGNKGVYNLQGGVLMPGDLVVGSPPQNNSQSAGGGIEQSGGTNIAGNISMVFGFYYLSNGTLSASSLTLTTNTLLGAIHAAEFNQYGGYNTNGALNIIGGANPFPMDAFYFLYGGTLETPSINMNLGEFDLRDATNRVSTLSLVNHSIYQMESGLLTVDNIQISEASTGDSEFWHLGGTLTGAKNVTLANGQWIELSTGSQFGQLQLSSGTNSSLTFQTTSPSCVLSFAGSSSVPWASDGILTIHGWSGSLSGGGTQQLLFGTSASGLTAQQVSQVQFNNPAGLPNGTYSARILSDGEVVPNQKIGASASVAFSEQGHNLVLTWPTGWTLQSATNVLGPFNDVTATSPYTNNMTQPHQFFRLRE